MSKPFRGVVDIDVRDSVPDWEPGSSPFVFTGGRIEQVVVDVSGEHFVDPEIEALAIMKRE